MSDDTIRAALRDAADAASDAYERDLDHRGIAAAAVAAFLRAYSWRIVNLDKLAGEVERAAQGGEG